MDEVQWPKTSAWGQDYPEAEEWIEERRLERENTSLRAEAGSLIEQLGRAKAELEELRADYEDHISRCIGEREA